MTIRLLLFGAPSIVQDASTRALEPERRTQLLAYIALKRAWVGRAEIAALLWPEQDTKLAYTNLRKALHRLQALPLADGVEAQGSALRCEVGTDVHDFETALREQRIADAVPLWRGELLTGFDDHANEAWTSWLGFERGRLRSLWRSAAQQHLAGELDPARAIDIAARLIETDPLDEDALRSYMTWLARAGLSARARQVYRDFVAHMESELGLPPSASLVALHDGLEAPVPATPAAGSSAAPSRDDGFIGRAVELRHMASLLAQADCRCVSVTGPGGVGKTRLAQRALDELAGRFEDGGTFVPLDDVTAAGDLGARLARELELSLKGRGDPFDQVIEALRPKQMLLVLDNLEQLADSGAPLLARLLEQCPRVKLVVTSRIRLGLAGEWLLPLEGLPCPDEEDRDNVESFDAARLFARAARHVQPDFAASSEAAAIVDICRQVEGHPLALELAAAWTRVLSCREIARELREDTELLHAVDPTHPARHASIEVVFEQSWRLLADVERSVLARLSVFSGSFTAEAARAVAGARLPVLGALVDKSLLRKEGPRLRLHPLVQQLAAERLPEGHERAQTEAAHASHFNQLLSQLKAAVAAGEREALATIDDEFENCRRAWAWSVEHERADALRKSANTLVDYWDLRGRAEEGLRIFRQALDAPVGRADPALSALLGSRAAHLEYRLDRYAEAEAHAAHIWETADPQRDEAARLQSLNVMATCAFRVGRLEDARRWFKLRLDATSPQERAHSLAVTLDHLALIEKRLGHYDEAHRLSLQSLEQHRNIGDRAGEVLCLNNLGSLLLEMDRTAEAVERLREGLAICDRDGLVSTRGFILSNLADVALDRGDLDDAETNARRGLDTAKTTGNRAVTVAMHGVLAGVAVKRGDLAAARASLAQSLSMGIELGATPIMFRPVIEFAGLLRAQNEPAAARRTLALVAQHPAATQNVRDYVARIDAKANAKVTSTLDFDELVRRIVSEVPVAYAPLIAALNAKA